MIELEKNIRQIVKDVMTYHKKKPLDCIVMSVLLTKEIQSKCNIDAKLVYGDLKWYNHYLFKCPDDFTFQSLRLTDALKDGDSIPYFDGHAWVEFGTCVIDASIFRTLYSSKYRDLAIRLYGEKSGAIIIQKDLIHKMHFEYQRMGIVEDVEVNQLFTLYLTNQTN